MTIERLLRLIAGVVLILSLVLAVYVNINFLWLTGFVAVNLLQSGFTNWCPMMTFLKKAGLRDRPA